MTFDHLATYFQKLEETQSRNAMTVLLAELFHHASSNEIDKICYLLQGRVVPLYEAIEFGVAEKFMIRAVAQASQQSVEHVSHIFKTQGDIGETAQRCITQSKSSSMTVESVYKALYEIALISGEGSQEKKITRLATLLSSVSSQSTRYIARIPLGTLRLGFSDMTMLDGLSWMLSASKEHKSILEDAYYVRPDIGYIAQQVKSHGISGLSHVKAKVGAPILASLCQRLPTADEMIKKMQKVYVEPKYDGERVQIHIEKASGSTKQRIHAFSRNLENITAMFPELERLVAQIDAESVILDSEAVGYDPKTGSFISFQETMTRKRKHDIQKAEQQVPLKFVVFDILYINGKDLLSVPLHERKHILEKTIEHSDDLMQSPHIVTSQADEIRSYHDTQRKKGLEGVVIKRWDSHYEPGRRGYSWVKFKEEEGKTGKLTDTIDAVVMGYYLGQGKRTAFGIGAFLVGVKKGEEFVTVTKIGTGVTDELWKEIRDTLRALKSETKPKEYGEVNKLFLPDVWVKPKVVVEIAGDDLTRSPSHGAGFAVRFPRLVRIRTDKSPGSATTTSEISQMFANQ